MAKKSFGAFDICCGAGGLSLGFEQAGFNILGGVDKGAFPLETVKENHKKGTWEQKTIEQFSKEILTDKKRVHISFKANIIIAGLPCQGFSTAGKRDAKDKRNFLYKHFIKIVKKVKPEFVVFENVLGLAHENNGHILNTIKRNFKKNKYKVHSQILNAQNYNVPQYRKRVILIASLHHDPETEIFPYIKKYSRIKTVRQAFSNLLPSKEDANINHTFMKHSQEVIDKIKKIKKKVHLSYRKLNWEQPSCTVIVGHNALPVHPSRPRAISVREAARLQGFPDNYIFKGTRTSQSEQVANAVPPPLAKAIAKAILKTYNLSNGCTNKRTEKKKHAKHTLNGNQTRAYRYA